MEQLQIITDKKKRTITVGDYVSNNPDFMLDPAKVVLQANNIFFTTGHPKHKNKLIHKHLGSKFKNRYYAALYNIWIDDDKESAQKLCIMHPAHNYIPNWLIAYNDNFSEIQMCKDDGIFNISPLIMWFSKSPHQLKNMFGKSCWKRLSKTSFSRNLLLARCSFYITPSHDEHQYDNAVKALREMSQMKTITLSTLLNNAHPVSSHRNGMLQALSLAKWIDRQKISHFKTIGDKRIFIDDAHDLIAMMQELELDFNPNWSAKRIKTEHNTVSKLYMIKRQGLVADTTFELSCLIKDHESLFIDPNIKFKVLTTGQDLIDEFLKMNHCILSYHHMMSDNRYVAIHIERDNVHYTLGIHVNHRGYALVDQIQTVNNIRCEDQYILNYCHGLVNIISKSGIMDEPI